MSMKQLAGFDYQSTNRRSQTWAHKSPGSSLRGFAINQSGTTRLAKQINREPARADCQVYFCGEWNTEGGRLELQRLMKTTHRLGTTCPVPTGNNPSTPTSPIEIILL